MVDVGRLMHVSHSHSGWVANWESCDAVKVDCVVLATFKKLSDNGRIRVRSEFD